MAGPKSTRTPRPHAQGVQVSWQAEVPERESLDVDVLIVGAGPAGLSCAIHLRRLLAERGMEDKTVLVLEKAEEVGYHILSGAVMDPRGIAELFPDWKERGCPTESEVTFDCLDVLWKSGKSTRVKGLFVPPPLHNAGNHIVSLYQVTRWLKDQAEELGAEVYPGFAGAEVLFEGGKAIAKALVHGSEGRRPAHDRRQDQMPARHRIRGDQQAHALDLGIDRVGEELLVLV